MYNLDDDEELTHYGQSLGELTTFDDADLQLTDDEDGEGISIPFATIIVACLLDCWVILITLYLLITFRENSDPV